VNKVIDKSGKALVNNRDARPVSAWTPAEVLDGRMNGVEPGDDIRHVPSRFWRRVRREVSRETR
jgi:hypothetical protein